MEVVTTIQTYPKYKKSRESWLGEIPEHWEEKKFKHIFSEKKKTTNIDLPCGSISFGKVVYKDDEKIPESTKRSYQVLSNGDFLINPLNLNYDLISLRIALSDKDVVVSSGYIILNNNLKLNKEYFKWLLHIFDVVYMKTLGSGVRQTLSFTHIANCELVFPPLEEQNKMAEFLETKTTKIDQAIAIKQKQIELLKERRQILIHKAVTRGLNDNVKLKDSDVEWIGKIPKHWEVKKVKHFGTIKSGESVVNSLLSESGLFEVYGGNGNMGFYKKYNVEGEKIIIGRVGAYCGNVRFINEKKWISDNALILSLNNNELYNYISILLKIGNLNSLNSSNAQPLITGTKVLNFSIPIPPKEEQIEITEFIKIATTKIATAISLKEQEIDKLKEYKMSLIDGVVTGKVKVC